MSLRTGDGAMERNQWVRSRRRRSAWRSGVVILAATSASALCLIGSGAPPTSAVTPSASTAVTASRLAAGGYHNCVITADTGVQCWGDDENGQLGAGPG